MKYYIVGIKGSGLCGMAQILYDLGNEVKGADVNQEIFTEYNLKDKNIEIESLDDMHYQDSDLIIVGNAFLNKYDFKDKKTITYQEMLSNLNDAFYSIAVCGTHGKTTTTNMIKHVLSNFEKTTYLVGDGQGHGDKKANYFVYEACEHRDHFLSYHPNMIVCSNIDFDHVEYFSSKKQYRQSFKTFFKQCKDVLVLNDSIDYKNDNNKNVLSYGLNNASLKAKNVRYDENGIKFDLIYKNETYSNLHLPFYGKHMLLDSLACIGCLTALGYDITKTIDILKTYKEAGRRYNITFVKNNVIIDDYGHHPKEIESTINAIKQEFPNKKLITVYHPDRPKRLTYFLNKYIDAFNKTEKTFVLPFLHMDEEGTNAINSIIDNKKIFAFNNELFINNYENHIFLFTGSKEMRPLINKLINNLER